LEILDQGKHLVNQLLTAINPRAAFILLVKNVNNINASFIKQSLINAPFSENGSVGKDQHISILKRSFI